MAGEDNTTLNDVHVFVSVPQGGIMVLLKFVNNVYTQFLTGCGKLRSLALITITGATFYIALVSMFAKRLYFGVTGVIIAGKCLLTKQRALGIGRVVST